MSILLRRDNAIGIQDPGVASAADVLGCVSFVDGAAGRRHANALSDAFWC
jgi:hypothetical protein